MLPRELTGAHEAREELRIEPNFRQLAERVVTPPRCVGEHYELFVPFCQLREAFQGARKCSLPIMHDSKLVEQKSIVAINDG